MPSLGGVGGNNSARCTCTQGFFSLSFPEINIKKQKAEARNESSVLHSLVLSCDGGVEILEYFPPPLPSVVLLVHQLENPSKARGGEQKRQQRHNSSVRCYRNGGNNGDTVTNSTPGAVDSPAAVNENNPGHAKRKTS